MAVTEAIPTVDISAWLSSSATQKEKDRVVQAMRDACHVYGFFYLAGHGVSVEDQERMLECARAFFRLPLEERRELWIGNSMGKSNRGYEPSGLQTHDGVLRPDTKEAFVIGAEIPADDPDAGNFSMGPNLWPKSLPDEEFRLPIMDYREKMVELVKVILRILARGLPASWNQPPDVFDEFTIKPSLPMRLLHYPPKTVVDDEQYGVGDHTDFGGVTVLLQEPGREGLEVWYPPTEKWLPVPVKENTFVINMGDIMQKWTNSYYRSARHRVITYSAKTRYSVPFFFNGNMKLKIKALDGSGDEDIVGEHIQRRFVKTLSSENKPIFAS
ncbi:Clavaminate synthase-like protein [Thozetella sp. PMI_491]|nr:Clavaminate synthase-like protein [Thozetella sp. PMI_491]